MKQYSRYPGIENFLHMFFLDYRLTVNHHIITLYGNHLAGVFIDEVFHPSLQYTCRQLSADSLFQVRFSNFNFFSKTEYLDNVLVTVKPYCTQQSRDRQFLLTVDVRVHHIVDVGSKLYPRATERYDTRGIKFSSVGMRALSEEHTRRTVKLRHDDTLSPIDDESSFFRHIWNRAKIHVLDNRVEILMIGISTIQLQFCLKRDTVSQTTLQTFLNRISRRVDIIV